MSASIPVNCGNCGARVDVPLLANMNAVHCPWCMTTGPAKGQQPERKSVAQAMGYEATEPGAGVEVDDE